VNDGAVPAVALSERITRVHAARVAAALQLDPAVVDCMSELPLGWHWAFCLAVHGKAALAPDGLPRQDPLLPQLPGFASRVMGSTRVTRLAPIAMETELRCETRIAGLVDKIGRSGPLRILTLERRYACGEQPVLEELQEVVYLPAVVRAPADVGDGEAAPSGADALQIDEVDVFRFSAATFNAHRLHYDATYARGVEGWPGILVQAKLLALHALQACTQAHGAGLRHFAFRSLAPLACPARIRIELAPTEAGLVEIRVLGAAGVHLSAQARY
jgi:3-methylfumaryl-CoA hydratase